MQLNKEHCGPFVITYPNFSFKAKRNCDLILILGLLNSVLYYMKEKRRKRLCKIFDIY